MDDYSSERIIHGLVLSGKGSGLVLRDSITNKDRNAQYSTRLGCSSRLNSSKSAQIRSSERNKFMKSSLPATSSRERVRSCSRTCPISTNPKTSLSKPLESPSSSLLETESSRTSITQDDPEVSELFPPPVKIPRGLHINSGNPESIISQRNSQRSGIHNQNTLDGASVGTRSKGSTQIAHTSTGRYALRNLRCNSVSDVIPSGCSSSSDPNFGRSKNVAGKRTFKGESSSTTRGKINPSSSKGQGSNFVYGSSLSDMERTKNMPPHSENVVASVSRSIRGPSRLRVPNQGNVKSPLIRDTNASSLPNQISSVSSRSCPVFRSRSGSRSENLRGVGPDSPPEMTSSLMNRHSFRRYNIDGFAEVLLALEIIERNEELTDEQLMLLETDLLFNGLNFFDRHRDLRLDIDNMSYEELLALEERMGTVSTALTKEAVSECLKRSIYYSSPPGDSTMIDDEDENDVKCSVCQEEYVNGDEVGKLQCEHRYHAVCIQQWLGLKNLCPICKAPAASSSASLPS